MKPLTRLAPLFLAAVFVATAHAEKKDEKPLVYVPVLPYQYLFERIGGDWIEVHSIVGEGGDPHDYSPTPRQLAEISKANLLFSGELAFESNFFVKVGDGVTAPKAIDLLEGLDLLEGNCSACLEEGHDHHDHDSHAETATKKEEAKHDEHDHEHGSNAKTSPKKAEEHEHEHAHHDHDHDDLKDPHVWLSPGMLRQQARRIASVLKEHTPAAAAADIDANLAALESDLEKVDSEIRDRLAPLKGEAFYVYHGAFAYFADAYGLEQKAIEVGGRRPTAKQIAELAGRAKKENVKAIFVQPQFDHTSAEALAASIGGRVQPLDPLEKDVLANLRTIAETIRSAK